MTFHGHSLDHGLPPHDGPAQATPDPPPPADDDGDPG